MKPLRLKISFYKNYLLFEFLAGFPNAIYVSCNTDCPDVTKFYRNLRLKKCMCSFHPVLYGKTKNKLLIHDNNGTWSED